MRKLLLFLATLSFLFFMPQRADASCLAFNGKFTAANWPDASKKIEVWCKGDEPLGPSLCTGGQQSVGPNEEFTLEKCSCLVDPEGKCLQVRNLPDGCTVDKTPIACGMNGPDAVIANFDVSCPVTPTPEPTTCVESEYCETWHTKDNVPPDNPNRDKILECLDKGYYVHTKKLCGNTGYEVSCDTNIAECKVPVTTLPPSAGPTCNQDCSADPTICQQAADGCTACVDNGSGGKTCQIPPSTGPTSTPPVNTPPPTDTPQNPTATPVPDFSEAMCKCDSMTVSQILAGQPAVFTATSKVTGSDVTKAEAKQIEFLLTAGNDASSRKVIAGPERVGTTASGSSSEMKYTAQWTTNIPANVEKNVEYVARATIKCSRKTTAAQAYPYTAMVLGESSERGGLFSMISNFFKNIFGGKTTDDAPASQSQTIASQDDTLMSVADKGNIQIGTFTTGTVTYNKCPEVRFKFQ